ncbi:MAG: HEAT repeat domain-containing protein [Desulfobacterales bacterium]
MCSDMPDAQIQNKAIELINHLNAAITNVRLYPPKSALIARSVDRLNDTLEALLADTPAIIYAESEKNLLIQGEPLSEKEQKKPQIQSFLSMLLELGIKSLSFEQGATQAELNEFVQLLGNPPAEKEGAGELKQLLAQHQISHILIDEKIYVERDTGQSILSEMDISDEDIARAIFGEEAVSEEAMDTLRELAKQPEWLSRVFQSGVKQAVASEEQVQSDLSERFSQMIDELEAFSPVDRQDISQAIIEAMAEMDDTVLQSLLTQNLNTIFGKQFFEEIARSLDQDTFNRLMERVEEVVQTAPADAEKSLKKVLQELKAADQAGYSQYSEALEKEPRPDSEEAYSPGPQPAAEAGGESAKETVKTALNQLLKGDTDVLSRLTLMSGLNQAVEKLAASGRAETINALFDRLMHGLESSDAAVKSGAADMIANMDKQLAANGRLAERIEWSKKLSEWIKQEAEISAAFETVSRELQEISETLIREDRAEDAAHILEAYQFLASGNLSRDQAIQALAANMLQNIATDDILDLLLKENVEESRKDGEADIYSLVILGTTTIERLLDRLRDSHNRQERNRIVQVVTRVGEPAVQSVVERLYQEGPWYYIRNLVMLLGRIGDASHMELLESFLTASDFRIHREAVLAIQNLGGERGGKILLNRLDDVSDSLKSVIISVLGLMNYRDALPYLTMSLENRSLGQTREATVAVNAKICEALGQMGDARAIPVLEKVIQARSFLGLKTYDPKVKAAAEKALAKISRK